MGGDPAERVTLDESVGLALLVALESLDPDARTVFVLREVFGLSVGEVAGLLYRTPAACRRLADRAKLQAVARAPRFSPVAAAERRTVDAVAVAAAARDVDAVLERLHPDVVVRSDDRGGGARRLLRRDAVARLLVGLVGTTELRVSVANDWPGLLMFRDGELCTVVGLTLEQDRVAEVCVVGDRRKLARIG